MNGHSLLVAKKLKACETGPFELIYILNNVLPESSNPGTKDGTIYIEIFPPIPLATVGSIACFFYGDIKSQYCTYASNSTQSTIEMRTPELRSFKESEIPITITTENAVPTNGFALPCVVQRYVFHIRFYINGGCPGVKEPVEVHFDEFVPEPLPINRTEY